MLKDPCNIVLFGPAINVTYPVLHLGSTVKEFIRLIEGNHKFCQEFWDVGYCTFFINESLFSCVTRLNYWFLAICQSSLIIFLRNIYFIPTS